MSAPSTTRLLLRRTTRTLLTRPTTRTPLQTRQQLPRAAPATLSRPFTQPTRRRAGLMPHTDEPSPSNPEPDTHKISIPTEISNDEYHEHADRYLESVHERAEQLAENREDVDVEYSAGVMNITLPPAGTYVLNKQPPNKQIWLSSPISGPKRFDWVVANESMQHKEGGGAGDWVYLRDGTSLTGLLRRECGISVDIDGDAEALKKPGIGVVE